MDTSIQNLRAAQRALKEAMTSSGRHSPLARERFEALRAIEKARLREPVPVFVPAPGSPYEALIRPKSGVVGTRELEIGRILVFYQDSPSNSNIVTYADRCFHAAGRLATMAPVVATASLESDTLVEVGQFIPEWGRVDVDPAMSDTLKRWLGDPTLDPKDLLTTSGPGNRKREFEEYIRAHQPLDPMTRRFLRQEADKAGVVLSI